MQKGLSVALNLLHGTFATFLGATAQLLNGGSGEEGEKNWKIKQVKFSGSFYCLRSTLLTLLFAPAGIGMCATYASHSVSSTGSNRLVQIIHPSFVRRRRRRQRPGVRLRLDLHNSIKVVTCGRSSDCCCLSLSLFFRFNSRLFNPERQLGAIVNKGEEKKQQKGEFQGFEKTVVFPLMWFICLWVFGSCRRNFERSSFSRRYNRRDVLESCDFASVRCVVTTTNITLAKACRRKDAFDKIKSVEKLIFSRFKARRQKQWRQRVEVC